MVREGATGGAPERADREAEELRRRLYAPDASPADVARYRAAAPVPVPEPPAPAVPVPSVGTAEVSPTLPRRRPGTRATATATAAVALVVLVGGIVAVRVATSDPVEDLPAPRQLSADRTDREEFEQNLALGNQAGISAYLVTHPSPHGLRGASRFDTIERNGAGPAAIDLTPVPPEAVSGGRATVLLVLAEGGRAAWTTVRREVDSSGQQRYVRQVRRGGEQPAGVLTATTFRYGAGDRPVRLRIDVPDGARWGVAVVFSD